MLCGSTAGWLPRFGVMGRGLLPAEGDALPDAEDLALALPPADVEAGGVPGFLGSLVMPTKISLIPDSMKRSPTTEEVPLSGGIVRAKSPWGERATFRQCFSSSDHTFGGRGPGS